MNFPSDFIPDNFVLGAVSLPMLFGCLGWQIGVIRTDWWSEKPVAGRITGSLYHWWLGELQVRYTTGACRLESDLK
jgi:hypothetical protein